MAVSGGWSVIGRTIPGAWGAVPSKDRPAYGNTQPYFPCKGGVGLQPAPELYATTGDNHGKNQDVDRRGL